MVDRKPGLTRESDGKIVAGKRFKQEVQAIVLSKKLERERLEKERLEQEKLTQEVEEELLSPGERDEFGTYEEVQSMYDLLATEDKPVEFLLLAEESDYPPSVGTLTKIRAKVTKDEPYPVEIFDYLVVSLAQLYIGKEDVDEVIELLEEYPVRIERDIFADYAEKQNFAGLELLTQAYGIGRFGDIILENHEQIAEGLKEELRKSHDFDTVEELVALEREYGTGKLAAVHYQHDNKEEE